MLEEIALEYKPFLMGKRFITDAQLSERLGISRRTLQDFRDRGIIPFYRLDGKILYEEKDIAEVKFGLLSCKYSLKIGRHSQNDIILCNRYVSKQHMILSCDGRDIYLEDCNSTCGTYVNGKRIRRTTLYPGDMISILTMQIKLEKSELVFEQFDGQILFKDIDEDSATICFFS